MVNIRTGGGPVLDEHEKVFAAAGDAIYAITASGTLGWKVPLQKPGRLLLASEGTLLAVSDHQRIYRIGPP